MLIVKLHSASSQVQPMLFNQCLLLLSAALLDREAAERIEKAMLEPARFDPEAMFKANELK